jgi:hypothetical protein
VITLQYFNIIYAHVAMRSTEITAAHKSQLAPLTGILQSRAGHSTRALTLVYLCEIQSPLVATS